MKPNLYKATPLTRADVFAAIPGLAVMEALFDTIDGQMFCVKNLQLQYIAVNQAFVVRARVSGKLAVLGRTAREVFAPLLAAGYEQQDQSVFSTGRAFRDKLEMISNPDGTTGWYLTQKLPMADAEGRLIALAVVSADLHAPAASDSRWAGLAKAVERIGRDYDQPLRIESLARAARMSINQFERRMRSVLRVSPRRLLTQTRVEAAARALRDTDASQHRIANDCGFYDQAQLCRQFRAVTGLTPGQYRASAQRMSSGDVGNE